ncbi:MAG TPA: beta-L-arabinofuranosidase domain-containing protein [Verrucomicrobiae bacterium]
MIQTIKVIASAILAAQVWILKADSLGFPSATDLPPTPVVANRQPLLPTPFVALPLGSVRPQGWLLKECELQRDGLTGNAETLYSDDIGTNSAWLGGTGNNWERGPYYYKGLVALAYTLNDAGLKQKAQMWMDWLLDHQGADGYIGPQSNDDWWPRMIATYALKDYYEATGDSRVPTVLDNYFHYMLANLPSRPLSDWGKARAGDEMDVALWLYNRNGDTNLLSLVDLLHQQAYDWPGIFTSNNFVLYGRDFQPKHNVNVEEALKMPAVYYQFSHQVGDKSAVWLGIDNLMRENALSFGINSGTEFISGNASIQGVELCAIVEAMLSLETAVRISGDPLLADRLETITYNALPAALANSVKGIQYYTVANNVIAVYGSHGFDEDYANATLPGPYSGYPCCRYNFHMGWPKFIQNSWAATTDGGLALIAYGPTMVNALAGDSPVQITEETDYPFEEQVRLHINMNKSAKFPLVLRIPGWCKNAFISVNGQPQSGFSSGSFFRIEHRWANGDIVDIHLPMPLQTLAGPSRAVAINRGPLVYSLRIGEKWTVRTPDPRGLGFDEFEVHSTTPWNYALQLDPTNPYASLTFTNFGAMPADPFDPAHPPVGLLARARQLPDWTIGWRGTQAFEPPVSPVASTSPMENVLLVPFGLQHMRLSWFPYLGTPSPTTGSFTENFDPSWCSRWTTFGGNWLVRNGVLSTVPASPNGAKALAMATVFTNFTYEGNVSVGPEGNAGLIFRVSKPDIGADAYCGYYLGINSGSSELELGYASNGWHEIATMPMSFTANKFYHLKIQASGPQLKIFVDHAARPTLGIEDDHFSSGMIGVRDFCTDHEQSLSAYSNLLVKETQTDLN